MKSKRYYIVKINSWDCNRNPYIAYNIVDRTLDIVIGQVWIKDYVKSILSNLNRGD